MNMLYMFVTLEVSQLEMSALKFCKFSKRELMSVIIETSQPAMEPYVSVAAVELASYACTTICREALVVKVSGGGEGEGGSGDGERSTAQVPEPQPEP